MPKVTDTEYRDAFIVYDKVSHAIGSTSHRGMPSSGSFLGYVSSDWSTTTVTPGGLKRIQMLLSPHGETLLRVWAVRHCPVREPK